MNLLIMKVSECECVHNIAGINDISNQSHALSKIILFLVRRRAITGHSHSKESSQSSGTSMRYKIETLNQSASKETRIQAVSLGWT